jgi:hypothetical protein
MGNQGGRVKTLIGISMLEARWCRVAGGGEERQRRGWDQPTWGRGWTWRVGPTWQWLERVEASLLECAKSKEIHLLAITPGLLGLNGLSVDTAACGAMWDSTGEACPVGPKSEENSFPNKIWIFEYTKALESFTRWFRRNFDMRIFLKIF